MSLFADLHCHPSFKPYGQSFTPGNARDFPESTDEVSLWHTKNATQIDALLTNAIGAAMYTQSSLESAAVGGVQIMGLSIGALEKEFITISTTGGIAVKNILSGIAQTDMENYLCNVITRCGRTRIKNVHDTQNYFDDLKGELEFVKKQEGYIFKSPVTNKFYKYDLVKNGAAVKSNMEKNAQPGAGDTKDDPIIISITLSVEGMHNLDANHGRTEQQVLENVVKLKGLTNFFFITFCHHFWNGLCGHAPSLTKTMGLIFDQKKNWKTGFNKLGLKVLKALLDKSNGRRILLDIKHLSEKARGQYYNLLDGSVPTDIEMTDAERNELLQFFRFNNNDGHPNNPPPIIVSHAAVNGLEGAEVNNKFYQGNYPHPAGGVKNPFENNEFYPDPSINLYDSDLRNIIRYRGIIGIQLDKRRIAGLETFSEAEHNYKHYQAYLVWNQVLHIVELWDSMGKKDAWSHVCIGSDFDGIINPMNGLNRLTDYPGLREGLLHYCKLYMMSTAEFTSKPEYKNMSERGTIANKNQVARIVTRKRLEMAENTSLTPEEIVDKICYKNALDFMVKWFV